MSDRQPLSIVMTPMQEQQAMQDYVRQRMAFGLPQPPPGAEFRAAMMPPPTLPGSAPLPAPAPADPSIPGSYGVGMAPQLDVSRPSGGPPGLDYQVNLGGNTLRDLPRGRALVPDIMYRRNFQF